jgi:hypothetical protein
MYKRKMNWQTILMVCIFGLLVVDILVTAKMALGLEKLQPCRQSRGPLPCRAVPTQFVIEEPECADKLLKSMNVTNVYILPAEALDSLLNKSTLRLQNLSER